MSKKLLAWLVCLSMLLTLLISCAENAPELGDPDPNPDTPATEQPDEEPEAPVSQIEVAKDGVANYRVIWDDAFETPTQLTIQGIFENYALTSQIEFAVESDETLHPAPKEILIGATDRIETFYGEQELQFGEYIISYHKDTDRILILGTSDKRTLDGLRYFLDTYTDPETASLTLPEDLFYISEGDVDYPIQYLLINGVSILRYDIVIPANCDISTYYAAQNLADYLYLNMGVTIPIEEDTAEEEPYEILIGETNRSASEINCETQTGEYVILQKDGQVVIQGNGIYVGAGNGHLITNYLSGSGLNRGVRINDLPTAATPMTHSFTGTYRNAILMIGDGMGFPHIEAALANGLEHFVANELPNYGSAITQSQSVINGIAEYTDSAASGTALSSGYKTLNGYIGKDASGQSYLNIRELADADGAKTAVVTTDVITGATPAAFLCHNVSRNNTAQLQAEIDELKAHGMVEYLAAEVSDRIADKTREGLMEIADSGTNFFMMVEEGHIDKFSHSNDTKGMMRCVNRFNKAIAYVIQFVFCHPDTALVITADHETGGLTYDPLNTYKYRYTTGNHTNADVPVYAFGPGTQIFDDARTDNTEIPKFLAKAFGNGKIGKAA